MHSTIYVDKTNGGFFIDEPNKEIFFRSKLHCKARELLGGSLRSEQSQTVLKETLLCDWLMTRQNRTAGEQSQKRNNRTTQNKLNKTNKENKVNTSARAVHLQLTTTKKSIVYIKHSLFLHCYGCKHLLNNLTHCSQLLLRLKFIILRLISRWSSQW